MSMTHKSTLIVLVMAALNHGVLFGAEQLARQPLFRVTDLNVGESQLLKLSDGSQANVKLLRIEETRDALRSALRLARVKVEVNGVIETIESGNYPDLPFYQQSSYATVYVLDAHGWIYRYTHLKSIDRSLRIGERIKIGQAVGRLGREEGAGYYAHLHFDIKSRKPS